MVIDEAKIDGKIILALDYSIAENPVRNAANFQSEIVVPELRTKIFSDFNREIPKENPETDTMIGKNVKMNEKM